MQSSFKMVSNNDVLPQPTFPIIAIFSLLLNSKETPFIAKPLLETCFPSKSSTIGCLSILHYAPTLLSFILDYLPPLEP